MGYRGGLVKGPLLEVILSTMLNSNWDMLNVLRFFFLSRFFYLNLLGRKERIKCSLCVFVFVITCLKINITKRSFRVAELWPPSLVFHVTPLGFILLFLWDFCTNCEYNVKYDF